VKKKSLAAGLVLATAAASSLAQSNLQIYGSVDAGLDFISNVGGSSLGALNTGRRSPDRFGFRGVEDLGGGLGAFFRLESGINLDTGSFTRTDVAFNRYALVGLEHRGVGSLSLGHMPDFMYEYLAPLSNAVPGLSASFSPGNLDNLANQFQLDNAIKFESADFGGFQAGAMYGFGEVPNSSSKSERYAAGVQYRNEALRVGLAYSMFHNRTADVRGLFGLNTLLGQTIAPGAQFNADRFRTEGIGASYAIGRFTPHVLVTDVSLGNAVGRTSLRNVEAGVNIDPFGDHLNVIGISGAHSTFTDRTFNQVNLFASHLLSKRTQVYVGINHQHAKGAGATAGLFGYGRSSDGNQTVYRVGFQNQF
jgi:predicted porin